MKYRFRPTLPSYSSSKKSVLAVILAANRSWHTQSQIVGDDTAALDSVLKADVWRDTLLREEASLNATLAELDSEGDDKRFEDARDEAQARLTEVHTQLTDMEAESGPARAAALLAGTRG